MLKTLQTHFYLGPNIRDGDSGLVVVAAREGMADRLLARQPRPPELDSLLQLARQVFPVVADSPVPADAAALGRDRSPVTALTLWLAGALSSDFCIRPRAARVMADQPSRLWVFLPCDDPGVGLAAWNLSMEFLGCVERLARDSRQTVIAHLHNRYRETRRQMRGRGLNQTDIAMARAARDRGIPVYRMSVPGQYLQLGQGQYRRRIMETGTDGTSAVGMMIGRDKFATAILLREQGLPTANTRLVASIREGVERGREIGFPLVVKPRGAGKGQGVTVDIRSERALTSALGAIEQGPYGMIVERHIPGDDHRLLVVDGRLVAAARRQPARVTGDGRHSVRELVAMENDDPRRGQGFERVLQFIELDDEAEQYLQRAGLTAESVPPPGRQVRLSGAANVSRGGTVEDVTEAVHPDTRQMVERVARLVGMDVMGIDFVAADIACSWREQECGVLEVNVTPGLRPHMAANPDRDVAGAIVDYLFPDRHAGRVPTVGITGSLGKTSTCNIVADLLTRSGRTVGLATTLGARVGRELLADPAVQAGVFELARGGLLKQGMVIDAVDVGAVLNVHDNHVGLDGVQSREEMARVKQLVVAHARKMAVLNADDPLCLAMRSSVRAPRVCLISDRHDNPEIDTHRRAGGVTGCIEDTGAGATLTLRDGDVCIGRVPVNAVPATREGRYRPAVVHALFAMAIGYGMGVDFATVRRSVTGFDSGPVSNPGRMNVIGGLPYQLLLSCPDGPVALKELIRYTSGLAVSGRKRLLLSSVDNRPDAQLEAMGQVAAGEFSEYICTDWEQLRERAPRETAGLLASGLGHGGVSGDRITIADHHAEAVDLALAGLAPGDLLVVATYGWRRVLDKLKRDAGGVANSPVSAGATNSSR